MSERRAQLAIAALAATAALLVFGIAVDAIHYHGLALEPHLALAVLDAVVIARAVGSLARQLRAQRGFLRRLPVLGTAVVGGQPVRIVPGRLGAFCVGLFRPQVYVAEGTLREGRDAELRAIVAHEAHHCRRRDPLRLLLTRVVSDALAPLPPFAALAARQESIAELAADAASVAALGDATPLAAALVRFDDSDAGVAPERVDRLVGTTRATTIPSTLLIAAGLVLAGVASTVMTMLLADWHPDAVLPVPLQAALLIAACAPAGVAARRAGA